MPPSPPPSSSFKAASTCRLRDAVYGLTLATTVFWSWPAWSDTLNHIATFEWHSDAVTGLSGLEVSEEGSRFSVISDRGWYIAGTFDREGDAISGITITKHLPILGNDGLPVAARPIGDWSDSEGLAIGPDGTHWISFERWARVSRFATAGSTGQWIKDHPSFSEFSENRQLEALALHPDGTLYTFPERPLKNGFPIYALKDGRWGISGHLKEQGGFSIVGADFAPDGTLYLLERKLVLGLWWQNQIRRLDVNAPDRAEILWTGKRGQYHNLEGIAVWHDPVGLRITMVSDDNGNREEVTQLVEYRVVP